MKTLAILGMALILPVVGLIYSGRILWSAVLALLAGLGLACSKSDGTANSGNPPGGGTKDSPEPVVTCYQTVAPTSAFSDAKWQDNAELLQWAYAERAILSMIRDERINFDQLQPLIKTAEDAYQQAQSAVGKGLLSAEAYQLAGQFFAEWHQTIATTHSEVLCYKSLLVTPMIADINTQLTTLNDLRRAGKLNKAAVEQAQSSIKQRMSKETSPAVAEELSRLLIQILEF
jgi:hypothetical protein